MYTLQQAKVFTLHEPFKLNYLVYKNYVISYWSQGESSVYVAVLKGAGQPSPNFFLFIFWFQIQHVSLIVAWFPSFGQEQTSLLTRIIALN